MLSTKEITKVCKGIKITSRVDWYKAKQKAGQKAVNGRCRGAVLRNFATCKNSQVAKFRNLRNLQVANFRNPAKFPLSSPSFQHFCSKFPLVRPCIFEFGSGSSCLNRIEDDEVFVLKNYNNRATKCDQ